MNPNLERLQPYPFQKLTALLKDVAAPPGLQPINLSIGEPKHATPEFIKRALAENLDGLASYPPTAGSVALRAAIAEWLRRRYQLAALDPAREVLPVNGSREALFAFAQAAVDRTRPGALVVCPNPFYQIYEGAALLAGAGVEFLNVDAAAGFRTDFEQLNDSTWERVQLIYMCSPANPTGTVMTLTDWRRLFELSDRYGFVIASDECYSEIYFDEARPPLGGLQAAQQLGRNGYPRLVCFGSLSKRSNVPGMRSGYVAGDAAVLARFLLYRTYHGSAMNPAVQAASVAAWNDEQHVIENRRLYREKFTQALGLVSDVGPVRMPEAAFYLWLHTPLPDTEFARALYAQCNLTVLPGSYLAREAHGVNPGRDYVRVALVPSPEECAEAMRRLKSFLSSVQSSTHKPIQAHP